MPSSDLGGDAFVGRFSFQHWRPRPRETSNITLWRRLRREQGEASIHAFQLHTKGLTRQFRSFGGGNIGTSWRKRFSLPEKICPSSSAIQACMKYEIDGIMHGLPLVERKGASRCVRNLASFLAAQHCCHGGWYHTQMLRSDS